MEITWKTGVPEKDSKGFYREKIVFTSLGNINIGIYTDLFGWLFYAPSSPHEKVVSWLDGLVFPELEKEIVVDEN